MTSIRPSAAEPIVPESPSLAELIEASGSKSVDELIKASGSKSVAELIAACESPSVAELIAACGSPSVAELIETSGSSSVAEPIVASGRPSIAEPMLPPMKPSVSNFKLIWDSPAACEYKKRSPSVAQFRLRWKSRSTSARPTGIKPKLTSGSSAIDNFKLILKSPIATEQMWTTISTSVAEAVKRSKRLVLGDLWDERSTSFNMKSTKMCLAVSRGMKVFKLMDNRTSLLERRTVSLRESCILTATQGNFVAFVTRKHRGAINLFSLLGGGMKRKIVFDDCSILALKMNNEFLAVSNIYEVVVYTLKGLSLSTYHKYTPHCDGGIMALSDSTHPTLLAAPYNSDQNFLCVWNNLTKEIFSIDGELAGRGISCLQFNSSGTKLAVVDGSAEYITILAVGGDACMGQVVQTIVTTHVGNEACSLHFSPNDQLLVAAYRNTSLVQIFAIYHERVFNGPIPLSWKLERGTGTKFGFKTGLVEEITLQCAAIGSKIARIIPHGKIEYKQNYRLLVAFMNENLLVYNLNPYVHEAVQLQQLNLIE